MYVHCGIRPSQIGSHLSPRLDRRHATRSGGFGLRRRRRRCYGKELPGSLNEEKNQGNSGSAAKNDPVSVSKLVVDLGMGHF